MDSTQGKILIASPMLGDPNFNRTVLLMVQHNEQGALGLVLNRPLETTVREACERSLGEVLEVEGFLHQGGPCEGPLMVLHTNEEAADAEVFPGVYFTTERSKVQTLLHSGRESARYFVGYSGWSAGQLESEMEQQAWVVLEPDSEAIFSSKQALWSKLNVGRYVDPSQVPDDPSVN